MSVQFLVTDSSWDGTRQEHRLNGTERKPEGNPKEHRSYTLNQFLKQEIVLTLKQEAR